MNILREASTGNELVSSCSHHDLMWKSSKPFHETVGKKSIMFSPCCDLIISNRFITRFGDDDDDDDDDDKSLSSRSRCVPLNKAKVSTSMVKGNGG